MSRLKNLCCILLIATSFVVSSTDAQSDIELEGVLEKIFSPSESSSMHALALRRDIIRRLYEALQQQEEDDLLDYKRSINSLARWGQLPGGKRNLAALAKGGYLRTIGDENDDDIKRSIANLAKNGQLPNVQNDESKRGIEALARNGELHQRRELQELLDDLYDKRNIGSIARNYNFPAYGKRYLGALARSNSLLTDKKNIASLVREGVKVNGKRNVAALLRQDKIHGPNDRSYGDDIMKQNDEESHDEEKRSLASLKAGGYTHYKRSLPDKTRPKRQVSDFYEINDEYASPVYQNQNIYDYEELMKALTGEYPNTEKRFLGSVARTGWFHPSSRIDKRHIGSLARLGWLPSFRSIRRFNRSGRSISECDREASADGKSKNYGLAENSLSIDDKRFLLQPAVDKILLEKVLMQSRNQ